MNKYIVEFIGTFFLVLTIGCSVILGATVPPLAIGSVLMAMIYAGGHISGAHYNPAVTLAVWVRGRCATKDVVPYWLAQILGAIVAAVTVIYLRADHPMTPIKVSTGPALVEEFLFTFALAFVVLNVATAKATAGNSYYGLAIGFTVLAGAFAVGGISGGAFNPAVAIGISFMGLLPATKLWIYLLANSAGGLIAGMAFKFLNPEDK